MRHGSGAQQTAVPGRARGGDGGNVSRGGPTLEVWINSSWATRMSQAAVESIVMQPAKGTAEGGACARRASPPFLYRYGRQEQDLGRIGLLAPGARGETPALMHMHLN